MPPQKQLRFTSTLEKSDNRLWGCHFEVPRSVAKELIQGKSRRVVCTLNGSAEWQCALVPHGNGSFVITVNKELRTKLGLAFGTSVNVRLRKDQSKYGLPVPEELEELLRQDKEGHRLFHALTAGKQRTLLYIIGQGKTPDNRVFKAVTIIRHLKANRGKIDYKRLSVMLRERAGSPTFRG